MHSFDTAASALLGLAWRKCSLQPRLSKRSLSSWAWSGPGYQPLVVTSGSGLLCPLMSAMKEGWSQEEHISSSSPPVTEPSADAGQSSLPSHFWVSRTQVSSSPQRNWSSGQVPLSGIPGIIGGGGSMGGAGGAMMFKKGMSSMSGIIAICIK